MLTRILSFVLVAYAALAFGNIFGFFIHTEYDLSGRAFAEWHRIADAYYSKVMSVVGLSGIFFQLLFLVLEGRNYRQKPFILVAIALILQIGVIILAISSNVAMNAEMNAWNPDNLPANWNEMRNEWLGYHARNRPFNLIHSICLFLGCYFYWMRMKMRS
jgi:glucan phosphoethanolaminetransferase (alkaline phosphatase superfamily)